MQAHLRSRIVLMCTIEYEQFRSLKSTAHFGFPEGPATLFADILKHVIGISKQLRCLNCVPHNSYTL